MTAAEIARALGGRRSSSGWSARCPAHDDKENSLSIGVGHDGRVLLKCHAGCEAEAIVRAMGLEWADLFPQKDLPHRRGGRGSNTPPENTATVQHLVRRVR